MPMSGVEESRSFEREDRQRDEREDRQRDEREHAHALPGIFLDTQKGVKKADP